MLFGFWFWTANGVKYENVIIGVIKRNTSDWNSGKGKQKLVNKAFVSLFILNYEIKLNSDLEIYRFIGLRHGIHITEMCSIDRKHRSKLTYNFLPIFCGIPLLTSYSAMT